MTFDTQAVPGTACIIGGLQIQIRWPGSDAARLEALGGDYENTPLDQTLEYWVVKLVQDEERVRIDTFPQSLEVPVDSTAPLADAVNAAILRILLHTGRPPVHGACIAPESSRPGVLLLGDSGLGKSSLTWLAVSLGWKAVSDDLVALRGTDGGETMGLTIRKRFRVMAHLVDAGTRSLGRRMRSLEGLEKVRLDPELVRPGSFLREARIGRLVFLERGASRSVLPVSRTETLERLLATRVGAMSAAQAGKSFEVLADLARHADAKVARLTGACLSDPGVLEELAA